MKLLISLFSKVNNMTAMTAAINKQIRLLAMFVYKSYMKLFKDLTTINKVS